MISSNRRALTLGAAALVVVASCASSSVPADVALEAQWQCDVQRTAFSDLEALNDELQARLEAAGMSTADYVTFKDRLGSSAELRAEVEKAYDEYCLP